VKVRPVEPAETTSAATGLRGSLHYDAGRRVDDRGEFLQCPRTMRLKTISCVYLFCAAVCATAQEPAGKSAAISLDDAVRMALEKNLEIKIGYSTPQISKLSLESLSGAYDPVFSMRAGENYVQSPGELNPSISSTPVGGGERWTDSYRLGFTGYLPSGATYDIGTGMSRGWGSASFLDNTDALVTAELPEIYNTDAGLTVTQPLLKNFWTDGTRGDIKIAKREIKASERAVEFTVMDTVHKVSQAYFDLVAARDQIKVREMALQLKEQSLSDTTKKVQAGTLAPLDEKAAASDAAAARADLIAARFALEQAENALKVLIADDFLSVESTGLEPTEKLLVVRQQFNKAESWRTALEKRPDYLREKEVLAQANIRLEYSKNQLFPSLDLVATYGRNGLGATYSDSLDNIGDNRFPRYGGALVLTVPLSRKTERANHKIRKVQMENQILNMKQRERDLFRGVDDAVKKVTSAYSAIESTREARVFAEAALDAEQKKLENGKSTNLDVLQLQDALTQARSREVQAIATYNKGLYDVYFAEGTLLERRKISVEMK
jgi:outer membrane protein